MIKKPVPLGRDICEKQLFHLIDRMEKVEVDNEKIDAFLPVIMKKLEWLEREEDNSNQDIFIVFTFVFEDSFKTIVRAYIQILLVDSDLC